MIHPNDSELEYVAHGLLSPEAIARAYEQDLLRVLLNEPTDEATKALTIVDAADFADAQHAELFRWLRKSYQKYRTAAPMELLSAMSAAGAKGLFALTNELWTTVPPYGPPMSWRVVHYAKRVHEIAQQRRLVEVSRIEARALAGEGARLPDGTVIEANTPAADVVAATAAARRKLAQQDSRAGLARPVGDFRDAALNEPTVGGLPFGIKALDEILKGGAKPGNLYILGARPAMGKTALMMNACRSWQAQDVPGVVFSLEMPGHQLYQRLLADLVGLGRDDWGANFERVEDMADLIDAWGLEIADQAGTTIQQVRAECERRAAANTLGWIMVDHLTIMGIPEGNDRYDLKVGAITNELKRIAKDYQIPVLLAAQLNRRVEDRANKRPLMSDLRETGKIEEDADAVVFLYRDHYYDPAKDPNEAEIIVAKHRGGPLGTAIACWNPVLTRFEDALLSDTVRL